MADTTPSFVYLASASPRRCDLLDQLGLHWMQVAAAVDESVRPAESATDYVQRVALAKARAARESLDNLEAPVLAADTAVVLDEEILGKPADRAEGLQILRRLSGRTHSVLTAVAMLDARRERHALSRTEVSFGDISAVQAEAYWDSGEPADKAGAYGIQGLGAMFVRRISGSYSGVVGLPLFETVGLLHEFGYRLPVMGPGQS